MKKQIIDYPNKLTIDNTDIFICSTPEGIVNTVTGDAIKTLVGNNNWLIITNALSPYNIVAGHRLVINGSTGSITINLPINPSLGDEILLITQNLDATNFLTINGNGNNINGVNSLDITVNNQRISLIFGLGGWVRNFFNLSSNLTNSLQSYLFSESVNYDLLFTVNIDYLSLFNWISGNILNVTPPTSTIYFIFSYQKSILESYLHLFRDSANKIILFAPISGQPL